MLNKIVFSLFLLDAILFTTLAAIHKSIPYATAAAIFVIIALSFAKTIANSEKSGHG